MPDVATIIFGICLLLLGLSTLLVKRGETGNKAVNELIENGKQDRIALDKLRKDFTDAQAVTRQSQAESSLKTEKLAKLTVDYEELKIRVDTFAATNAQLAQEKAAALQEAQKATADNAAFKEQVTGLITELATERTARQGLQTQLDAERTARLDLEQRFTALELELKKTNADHQEKIAAKDAELAEVVTARDGYKTQLDDLQGKFDALKVDYDKLLEKTDEQTIEINTLRLDFKRLSDTVAKKKPAPNPTTERKPKPETVTP